MTLAKHTSQIPQDVASWLTRLGAGDFGSTNVWASESKTFDVLDPGTAGKLVSLPASSAFEVVEAVARARREFETGTWRKESPDVRERTLLKLADLVNRDFEFLSTIEALDTGKPLEEARFDIAEVATVIRYYAGWANKVSGQTIATTPDIAAMTVRGPVGVCAAITPWNYPLPILMYKLAPALAFGNAFIAKPSELAPLSSIYFAQLCSEAGLPQGTVNLVLGAGTTGADLVEAEGLDKIAFTGSSRTGQLIMQAAAKNVTKVTLELGGKSPQLVFASADIPKAVEGVARGIWTNAGQVCVAGSRLIIEQSIKDEFLSELEKFTDNYLVGHSLDSNSTMGPIISEAQLGKISQFITKATQDGANVIQPAKLPSRNGYFMKPTIIDGLPESNLLHQEEIFGPVLAVSTFTGEAEAVRLANSTRYGLAAGVWTGQAGQGQRVARAITSGTVWLNTYGMFHPTLPFGGTKSSGFGRELGESAVDGYTELKTIVEDIGGGSE